MYCYRILGKDKPKMYRGNQPFLNRSDYAKYPLIKNRLRFSEGDFYFKNLLNFRVLTVVNF